MMKKEYLKPEMLVEEILVETMIATSQTPVNPEEKDEFDSNGHRGGWGDLWN